MTLSMAVMPMSNFPSIRFVSWNTDDGVGVSFTRSPSRAKEPFAWAAQIGQLKPPGKTMTSSGSCAPAGTGRTSSATASIRATVPLMARTLPRLTPEGAASYDRTLHRGGDCHGHQGARAPPSRHPRRRDAGGRRQDDEVLRGRARPLARSGAPVHPDDPGLLDGRRRQGADPPHGRQRPVEVRTGSREGSLAAARRARRSRHPGDAKGARPARRRLLGVGGHRGAPVTADLHARPGGEHDRAPRGGHLPVQGGRPRRRQRYALTMARLSAEAQQVVERVQRLTRERIAPRAADYDRAGQNPVESWRELWAEGYLASAIPRPHGGLGLDMPTYTAVVRTIAQGCANTAMTLHMHSTVMRFIDTLGTEAQKRRYFPEVVRFGKLFGSWGSEPAVSLSRTFLMETAIRRNGDDWVIDGVKHFCTMALGASRLVLDEAAASWAAADMVERALLANRAKYLATEVGLHVTSKVIQVVGGRGAYKDYPAERALRDVRTATLMPPTVDRMLEAIGKSALGIQEGMFRFGSGPQGA